MTTESREKLEALKAKRATLFEEISDLEMREQAEGPSEGLEQRRTNITKGISNAEAQIDELRDDLIAELESAASRADASEAGMGTRPTPNRTDDGVPPHLREARDAALRGLERNSDAFSTEAGSTIERIVRTDTAGATSRYLAAVSDPDYDSAFGKLLAHGSMAQLRMTPAEQDAVRRVTQADSERAMTEGTTTAGGFGVPVALDPTIALTSSGVLNPIREVASVRTVGSWTWKGVSSDGVTASWDLEAEEVSDDAPTLAQPTIQVQKGAAWIPFSIEVDQDYPGLRQELANLLMDGRDVLESSGFYNGTASPTPTGIVTGMGTAVKVASAGTATLAIGDVYGLIEAVPPRFQPGMSVLGSPTMWDRVFRLTPSGSTSEPQAMPTREGPVIGRRKVEWSAQPTVTTSTTKVLIAGDIAAGFRIVDRIGMTVELVPHLLGSNRRPTGQRGLYAYWRVGSGVIAENALRYLQIL